MENNTKQSLVELLLWAYKEGFKNAENLIKAGASGIEKDSESLKNQFSEVLDKLSSK